MLQYSSVVQCTLVYGSFCYRVMAYLVITTVYDLHISAVTTTTITADTTTTTTVYIYRTVLFTVRKPVVTCKACSTQYVTTTFCSNYYNDL